MDENKYTPEMIIAAPEMLDALYSILNIEHFAILGSKNAAAKGISIAWHFAKVRMAIKKATTTKYVEV
ncbi:hypothetical protein [Neomegalonema sp.]|uniref:hypothetical protein n=1 Tax=Neomegalonema sp. TaxID=2039713 RepID=UPI002638A49E|nr:hypothetical protein [Neomegalonema sp.]MDD2869692.1 hypothetical protein [Neomegalonema sp.]